MAKRRWQAGAGICCAALAQGAAAQALPLAIHFGGETVVTATRIAQPAGAALRQVTVITAAQIEASTGLTLAELLRQHGGLEMAANGGHGGTSSVFMRGANAAHTLVLVDGIRLQSASAGVTAFENIPLAQIERIEIVPGPASSLYGSDAVGGVIQIFTKGARGAPAAEASLTAGSFDTLTARASAGARSGATSALVSAAWYETGNFDATRPTVSFGRHNPDRDPYRNASVSARLEHRFGGRHALAATALASRGETRFDNGPGDDRTEQTLATVSIESRNRFSAAWTSLVRVGASRDDSESLGGFFPARFRTDQRQATWQNTFALGASISLVAGVEHLRQELDSATAFAVDRRTIDALFAGVNAERGAHALQASVRRDDNSQFGAPTTGSVAYGIGLAPRTRLRAAWGTAFHAPSFNDLHFPGFGNPALAPERSRSAELGLDWRGDAQRLAATYFDNRIRNLIVFVFDPASGTGQPENVARARIRGLELAWDATLAGTELRAKATFQQPEAEPSGARLQRRARRHASLSAARALGAWRLGAEVLASSARFDSADEAPGSRLAGYALVHLTASRQLARDWSLQLRWNNATDRDYELVQGFNTPGSHVLATLRWAPQR